MTARMVDCLYPPADAAGLEAVKSATGATVIGLYVPGWGVPLIDGAPDSTAIGRIALDTGWQVVPILDPSHGPLPAPSALAVGHQMVLEWLSAIGADTGSDGALLFDLEAGDFTADLGLCKELAAAWYALDSLRATQYGSPSGLAAISGLPSTQRPERVWCSSYEGTTWPTSPATIPGLPADLWNMAGQRGWQWFGSAQTAGGTVDLSVVDWPTFGPAPAPAPTPDPTPIVVLSKGIYQVPAGSTITVA